MFVVIEFARGLGPTWVQWGKKDRLRIVVVHKTPVPTIRGTLKYGQGWRSCNVWIRLLMPDTIYFYSFIYFFFQKVDEKFQNCQIEEILAL